MSLAPGWLDALSHAMPLRYLVDAVRDAYAGASRPGTWSAACSSGSGSRRAP
jgi:hypothetical protein